MFTGGDVVSRNGEGAERLSSWYEASSYIAIISLERSPEIRSLERSPEIRNLSTPMIGPGAISDRQQWCNKDYRVQDAQRTSRWTFCYKLIANLLVVVLIDLYYICPPYGMIQT